MLDPSMSWFSVEAATKARNLKGAYLWLNAAQHLLGSIAQRAICVLQKPEEVR
jgi:hypothetical protein